MNLSRLACLAALAFLVPTFLAAGCDGAGPGADASATSDAGDASIHDDGSAPGFDAAPLDASIGDLDASNGSLDAGSDAPGLDAGPLGDPMAACAIDRDVFYANIIGAPGPFRPGAQTFTNHDTQWQVSAGSGLEVSLDQRVQSATLQAYAANAPAVGTYAIGADAGVRLSLAFDGNACDLSNGSYTITDLATDDAGTSAVKSLGMWFDADCNSFSLMHARGCARFTADAPFDAGVADAGVADAGADAAASDPCAGGAYVFHVDGEGGDGGYGGISGPMQIDDSIGTWSASLASGQYVDLIVDTGDGEWRFVANAQSTSLVPGNYVSTGAAQATFAEVMANGLACTAVPTGTFVIGAIESTNGDQALVTKLRATFDLQCPGQGEIRGCVSYGK